MSQFLTTVNLSKGSASQVLMLLLSFFLFSTSVKAEEDNPDPWEDWNRKVFAFNDTVDYYVAKPVAQGYRYITPDVVDDGITNFFSNLGEPFVVLNNLLQLKFADAASDTGRFIVNSTVGILGFVDVASRIGLEKHQEDFGQTLGYWGVESGPYVVLPVLGPSSVRDSFGLGVDLFVFDRLDLLQRLESPEEYWGAVILKYTDIRGDLIPTEELISGDKYSLFKSLYLQRRNYLVNDGAVVDDFGDEDFDEEEWED